MRFRDVVLASVTLAMPGLAWAQPVTGFYISGAAGANFLQDETIKANPSLEEPNRKAIFDPGFSGEVSLGYGLGNGLRVEIEGDFLDNHVHKIVFPFEELRRAGGLERQYGGMVNALYDFDFNLPVYPFVGVGVGGQIMNFQGINSSTPGFKLPQADGGDSVGAFAYQGMAGVAVPLPWVAGLSFTVEYRMLGLLDPLPAVRERVFRSNGSLLGVGSEQYGNVFNHQILLGVRYAFGTPAPAPAPVAAPVAVPAPAPARSYLVFFDWDKATLSDRARQIVAEAAQASTRVQVTRIQVNGYTDTSGTPRYNQGLSLRRAAAVQAELVRDGVSPAEISVHGYGETHLLVSTGPGVREPQNRRVEIVLG